MQFTRMYLTENVCFKRNRPLNPTGIVVHSTGVNNSRINRYVGPGDDIIGFNTSGNHWNREGVEKCVHAFIGHDQYEAVRCYNTLPWEIKTWGCGKGEKGSFNQSHIQFEICEDDLSNEQYFTETFEMAADLCVYLCKLFEIPADRVVSHKEASSQGFASHHMDPHHWMEKHGWTMDMFREKVSRALAHNPPPPVKM